MGGGGERGSGVAMTGDGAHPRGLFGLVDGRELPFVSWGSAGSGGVPVDYVSARLEDAPQYAGRLLGTTPPRPGYVRIPVTDVNDLRQWDWFVVFEGTRYEVGQVRDGKFLIGTDDQALAQSGGWEGSLRDGWRRWIDPSGLPVTVESHELKLPRA